MTTKSFEVILFDLGGVLIELSGISTMMGWTDRAMTVEELWRRWLASPGVRLFESGQIPAKEFAQAIVEEFSLAVDGDHFIEQFASWPSGPYPGTAELLNDLSSSFRLASLSNTNELHWGRMVDEMGVIQHFDANFPSHLTGHLKPDGQTFTYVAEAMGCDPGHILFLDDNQINVAGARSAGMVAYTADGIDGAKAILQQQGLIG